MLFFGSPAENSSAELKVKARWIDCIPQHQQISSLVSATSLTIGVSRMHYTSSLLLETLESLGQIRRAPPGGRKIKKNELRKILRFRVARTRKTLFLRHLVSRFAIFYQIA